MAVNKLQLIRRRRALRPTRKVIPKQAHPLGIEREYARALKGMMSAINAQVQSALAPLLKPGARQDAPTDPVDIRAPLHVVLAKLRGIKAASQTTVTAQKAGLLAQGIGTKTSKFNKVAMGDQIKAVIGVDPLATLSEPGTPGILADFIAENVKLIESIPERYFQEVGEFLGDAVPSGKRAEDVAALIQERYNVSESRANLIARDQVSKLNGNLTKVRQEGLGITGYTWRTSLDERVRPSHAALEGQTFSWDSPPSIGHPGEDYQCRCRSEPQLSALIGDDE